MKGMTTVLREILARDETVVYPGIYNALSAGIAERIGFKMVGLGGYALGACLGTAEPLLGLEALVRTCRYITALINIPLKVDAGAGFGEPLHVMRAIRELEAAGAAAVHIEDQIYPKRAHYHKGVEHLIDTHDMVAKLKAAIAARRDPDFAIIARTDAMLVYGFAEGVRRANSYLEAGADMAFIFPNTIEEAREAPRQIDGPLVYYNGEADSLGRPVFTNQELQDMGYKMVAYSDSAIMAATKAVKEMLENLKTTGGTGLDQSEMKLVREYLEDSVGLEDMYKLELQTVERH
jgi:methylisocitrate lyase